MSASAGEGGRPRSHVLSAARTLRDMSVLRVLCPAPLRPAPPCPGAAPGDMIVRPSFIELSQLNRFQASISKHLLRSYQASFKAVIAAQVRGGLCAGVHGWMGGWCIGMCVRVWWGCEGGAAEHSRRDGGAERGGGCSRVRPAVGSGQHFAA